MPSTSAQSVSKEPFEKKNAPSKQNQVATTYIGQSVGIDIAKSKFDACLMLERSDKHIVVKATRSFENNTKGIEAFEEWLKPKLKASLTCPIVMEATGVYYENLAYFLANCSTFCSVHVVLARVAKNFLKSLNAKSKTDKIDAQGLAQMAIERRLDVWQPPREIYRTLRSLSRERDSLIAERSVIKNQVHAEKFAYASLKSKLERAALRIQMLDNQINSIEIELLQIMHQDEDLKQRFENVCTIPGIGKTTALVLIAETQGFFLFTNQRQVASYAGLDVMLNQSGDSLLGKPRISKRGNAHLRKALYFSALTHVKHKGTLTHTFFNVLSRSAIKMKGYVAVQRKLLILAYTLFKKNVPYDPNINMHTTNVPKSED